MSSILKLSTGVPGFDILSNGGIPRARSTLVVGRSGTGKTILALQIAGNLAVQGVESLLVAVEVCSTTYFLDDEAETAVANAIFADGAGAVVLGATGPRAAGAAGVPASASTPDPVIVGHRTLIRSEHLGKMGFTFPGGRHRVLLSPDVRRIAPAMMEELALRLLKDHGVAREEVRFWILHSAGRRVIERVLPQRAGIRTAKSPVLPLTTPFGKAPHSRPPSRAAG